VRWLLAGTGCAVVFVAATTLAWGPRLSFLLCIALGLVVVIVAGWVGFGLGEQHLAQQHEARNGLPRGQVYDTTSRIR
jgi:hypothetical protein